MLKTIAEEGEDGDDSADDDKERRRAEDGCRLGFRVTDGEPTKSHGYYEPERAIIDQAEAIMKSTQHKVKRGCKASAAMELGESELKHLLLVVLFALLRHGKRFRARGC